jgi:hypothetical protein
VPSDFSARRAATGRIGVIILGETVSIQNVDDLSPQDSAAALFVVASFDSYVMMKTREKNQTFLQRQSGDGGFVYRSGKALFVLVLN